MSSIADGGYDLGSCRTDSITYRSQALGFKEMRRVARFAAVAIEPHWGLVGRVIGTELEVHGDAVN